MNLDAIQAKIFEPLDHSYVERDSILYALGLGYGDDPLDEATLPFVYEKDLRAVPAMVNILAHPGFWARELGYGIDWVRLLHAEQYFEIHAPLPATGQMRGYYRVSGVEDKGAERGALLHQEKRLEDTVTKQKIATVRSTLFLRGDGGQGGFGEPQAPADPLPDRAPDRVIDMPTLERQALIYRLSGDWNPLHVDPAVADKAGFPRPILHGLCTNGIACRAVLAAYCENEPTKLRSLFTRFSKPVLPGETIRIEFFEESDRIRFRAVVAQRGEIVLDRCTAVIS